MAKNTTRILIVLTGQGGELDRSYRCVEGGEGFEERLDEACSDVIEGWLLSIGDTITITEAPK